MGQMARGEEEAPFLQGASGRGLGRVFFGLVKVLRSALVSAVSRLRCFVYHF